METLHITEEEFRRDLESVLERVRSGIEVVVLQGAKPPVRLSPGQVGRTFSEMLALLPSDSDAVMDDEFARDVQEGIERLRQPLDSAHWD